MNSWRWAQGAMVVLTAVLLAGLWLAPVPSLALFWGVVVPLLPLSFLVSPLLWRAVCPLATLNMVDQRPGRRRHGAAISRWSEAPALIALAVLVPARQFAFNREAWALAALVVAVAIVAFLAGRWFDAKAGFCNLLCPILPVERLYGQRPLVVIANPRCTPCTMCTPRGCLDLAGAKSVPQLLGPPRRSIGWMGTAFGLFAMAFPGFIAGYFTVVTTPVPRPGTVYGHVLEWAALSAIAAGGLVLLLRPPSRMALALLAGLAAGLYYWFTVPLSLVALGAATAGAVVGLRLLLLGFIGWWTVRAVRVAAPFAANAG